ncbi:MAG: replication-associated recombination protein A [Candidatus Omnitrophica bacterium]|nr:replication-associated recombination protein A [Candidatus Omnitrophota bacterium]
MDLFLHQYTSENEPLASRIRPIALDGVFGQEHILSQGKLLRRAIESDKISSVIFYGPPGCGKTTLARVICQMTESNYVQLNAVKNNVTDIRKVISQAEKKFAIDKKKTIVVIDEIHRFNKAQQDALMEDVEKGNPILIGTTTENPFFSVNSALLSRSQIFEFKPLSKENIKDILKTAVKDDVNGLGKMKIKITEEALEHLCQKCEGDARIALSALELGALTTQPNSKGIIVFDQHVAQESIQKKIVLYDKDGDGHYDTASAFIKSMRGSDPDAALYWLAKMIVAGEDVKFVARRIVICASEDVGNADPHALIIANAACQSAERVGFPEARIILAQACVYVACAPKSNAVYLAIDSAIEDVNNNIIQKVPKHLKDTHYKGAKEMGHGKDYKYAHDYENHYVKQEYMPEKKQYYFPTNMGYEKKIKEWIERLKKENG